MKIDDIKVGETYQLEAYSKHYHPQYRLNPAKVLEIVKVPYRDTWGHLTYPRRVRVQTDNGEQVVPASRLACLYSDAYSAHSAWEVANNWGLEARVRLASALQSAGIEAKSVSQMTGAAEVIVRLGAQQALHLAELLEGRTTCPT